MSLLIVTLTLCSALAHATWNLLAKRVATGATFIWLFDGVAILVCAPATFAIVALQGLSVSVTVVLLILGSTALHLGYFIMLNRGYRLGDLSLVYPVARGSGPLLATIAAITFLGERPGPLALVGVLLVVGGAVALTGNVRQLVQSGAGRALAYAVMTGGFIAAYTIVDKEAVSVVLIQPIVYFWCGTVVEWVLLTPWAVAHREEIRQLWRSHHWEAIGIGVLSPLAYILVLTALVSGPVSHVAPMREIGVLFGVVMGSRLLGEGDARRRLSAAGGMVLGVACIAID